MELLAPAGLAALVALPAIVALYFLRRRNPPRVIGSLLLWTGARAQVLRGRPWERFRPTTSLWLQLLAAAALAMALAYPACVHTGSQSGQLVIVLDASASMGATDGSPRRWDDAIDAALSAIEGAPDGAQSAILVAGVNARLVEPLTTDRGALRGQLESLRRQGPDEGPGAIQQTILLGFQLAGADKEKQVVLLTDGAFDHRQLPALAGRGLEVVVFGSRAENLAITTFSLRRDPNQAFQGAAIVTTTNTGPRAMRGHLEVHRNDEPLEAHRITLQPGESRTLRIPFLADEGRFTARLQDVEGDMLPADNIAYAVLSPPRPIHLRMEGVSPLVERVLLANPRIRSALPGEPADITILEGPVEPSALSGRLIIIDPSEASGLLKRNETIERPVITYWDQGHPVLHHVDLSPLRFGAIRQVQPAASLAAIAEFSGQGGPALLVGQTPSWRAVVIPFSLTETDLPLKVTFPVLLYNAVGWLAPGAESTSQSLPAGASMDLAAPAGSRIQIEGPDGHVTAVDAAITDGSYLHGPVARSGFYRATVASAAQSNTSQWAVSVTNLEESHIAPRRKLTTPRGGTLSTTGVLEHTRSLIPLVLLIVLAILALEWWLFLRRTASQAGGARS